MKYVLTSLSMKHARLNDIISTCKRLNIKYHLFSQYEDLSIDNLPFNLDYQEYIGFTKIPLFHKFEKFYQDIDNHTISIFQQQSIFKTLYDFEMFKDKFDNVFQIRNAHKLEQSFIIGNKEKFKNVNLLNSDSLITNARFLAGQKFEQDMFIKPNSIYKQFVGMLIPTGFTIEQVFMNRSLPLPTCDIQISFAKKIINEYRFIAHKGKIVGGSSYFSNQTFDKNLKVPLYVQIYAEEIAKQFQPTDTFSIDLAEMDNGLIEIVEFNPFSCSGLYGINLDELFLSLCQN